MPVILPIILLSIIALLVIQRIIRSKKVSLTKLELTAAFGIKVIFGCLYGYIFLHYYGGDDTWYLNQSSIKEQSRLLRQAALFFDDLNPLLPFQRNETFWAGLRNFFGDLEYMSITKPLALFNFISRGNYYVNIVFFSFLTFWGHYWLFSLLVQLFPHRRKGLLLLIFFYPPIVFWLSGIRGDGLLFLFLSLLLLHFYRWVHERRAISLLYWLIGLFGVLVFRNAVGLILVPGLVSWFIVHRGQRKAWPVFLLVYGMGALLFFGSILLSPTNNLPAFVAGRQQAYQGLTANTRYRLDALEPTVGSYVTVLPQALNNTFLRPYAWEAKGALQLISAIDIIVCWLLVLGCFAWRDARWKEQLSQPLILCLLFFSVILYLFIGYTVPFPGAIVRYKIIPELLLYSVLLLNINYKKIYI